MQLPYWPIHFRECSSVYDLITLINVLVTARSHMSPYLIKPYFIDPNKVALFSVVSLQKTLRGQGNHQGWKRYKIQKIRCCPLRELYL